MTHVTRAARTGLLAACLAAGLLLTGLAAAQQPAAPAAQAVPASAPQPMFEFSGAGAPALTDGFERQAASFVNTRTGQPNVLIKEMARISGSGTLQLSITAFYAPEMPAADKTRPQVEQEQRESVSRQQDRNAYHFSGEVVQLDGSWFSATGFNERGTRDGLSALHYYGNHGGRAYLVIARFDAGNLPVAQARAMVERIRLPQGRVDAAAQSFMAMSQRLASPAGVTTPIGLLQASSTPAWSLKSFSGILGKREYNDGLYKTEFASGDARLEAFCLPVRAEQLPRRRTLEQGILSDGGATRDVAEDGSWGDPANGLHRYRFQARMTEDRTVPGTAWTVIGDGKLIILRYLSGTSAGNAAVVDALQKAMEAPGRVCRFLPWAS